MAVYDTFDSSGWIDVGGTSAGAPQWAALIAIADQGRTLSGMGTLNGASQTLAAIYAAPSADFHDITTGSTQFESAGPGYDLATGLGSPVANLLIPYLASYGSEHRLGFVRRWFSGGGTSGGGTTSAPAAPTNFTATAASSSQIDLSWSASTGAVGYNVYEMESGKAVLISTLTSGTTSLVVSGLSASTTYSFEVAAYNTAGSTATGWAQATTQAIAVTVAAPTNLQVTATSSTVAQISWSTSAGAPGYLVFERSGNQFVQMASVGAGTTSVSIGGQTAGAAESFYVTAYNANFSSIDRIGQRRHAKGNGARRADECDGNSHLVHHGHALLDRIIGCNELRDLLLERPPSGVPWHGQWQHDIRDHLRATCGRDHQLRRRGP